MHKRRRGDGFTMLELMMVLAVIAVLALIALPSYIDRIVRQQIDEALPLADLAKPPVEAAWRVGTPLPHDNAAAGLPPPEKIVNQVVQSVTLEDGAIQIHFGNRAQHSLQGKTLTLRPAGVVDARIVPLTWLCGRAGAPPQMTAQGEDRTNVPGPYLPLRCR
ncbi:pilin [Ramlibacter sp.]|uniref:pilin n=1 Tax=Ramlibacter sp. TaxID=1917967 RepID=UPI0026257047|nr:pilin [Ramlibacter sp.]